jgi:hypothetical protein
MAQKVIQILTLNDSPQDFARLFGIWSEANDYFEDICFDFSRCGFLRPNAVAFLGGLARLIESRMGSVTFDWGTLHKSWVRTTIRQNGFACAFGDASAPWDGTSIRYREDREFHPDGVGLDLLKSFIRVNGGTMLVFSNDGFAEITKDREVYDSFSTSFEGTVFHIKLICNENYYCLAGEAPLE